MEQNNMLAMILAGGRGTRLYELTKRPQNQPFTLVGSIVLLIFQLATARIRISMLSVF